MTKTVKNNIECWIDEFEGCIYIYPCDRWNKTNAKKRFSTTVKRIKEDRAKGIAWIKQIARDIASLSLSEMY